MASFAPPAALNGTFVEALRSFSAKFVAEKAKVSPRTVEGWKQGRSAPQGRHVIAMLSDDQLCARLLDLANQGELVRHKQTIAALKAAIATEQR